MKRKTVPAIAVMFVILMVCIDTNFVMAQSELSLKVDELADKLTSSMSGQVIGVKGDSIYIDLGEKDSVLQGSEFEVVRLGEVMMVGEKAYHQEDYVADIEVTRVRKDMSIARMASKTAAQIKKGDKVYQKSRKVKRIAIVEFPHEGRFNNFTMNLYESLSVFIVQKGYQVVERSQLDKVLEELKTSHSGLIDVSTMKKLGKMVGAEAILLGSVADLGNELAIRARLIDVEKGMAISAAQVGIVKNPSVLNMTAKNVRKQKNATTLNSSSRKAKASNAQKSGFLFYEDFSNVETGMAPKGWLGTEHVMVQSDGKKKFLTNFEKGPSKITIRNVQFPENFAIEWYAEYKKTRAVKLVNLYVGNLKAGISARSSRPEKAWINNTEGESVFNAHKGSILVSIEKNGSVFRLLIDGSEKVIARLSNFKVGDSITIDFWGLNFKLYKILIKEL